MTESSKPASLSPLSKVLRVVLKPLLKIARLEVVEPDEYSDIAGDLNYQRLFENATAGIGRTSVETGRVLFANSRLAEIFGYDDVKQFIDEFTFSEHYPDADGRRRQLEFYRNHPGELVEATYTDRFGELVYVQSEVRLDSEEKYIDFVLIDVSDKKIAEIALQESQRDYQVLFENAAVGVGRSRISDGKILLANQKLAEMYGYQTPEQMIEEYDFPSGWVNSEERDNLVNGFDATAMQVSEQKFRRRDGSILTLIGCDVHIEGTDWFDYIAVDTSDIEKMNREKQEYENIVNAMINHSPIPVSVKDLEDRYIFVSSSYADFLKKTNEELEGSVAGNILEPETARLLHEADKKIKNTGKPLDLNDSFPVNFGSSTLQVTKFPINDENGEVTGIGTIGIDVTEAVRNERELEKAKSELEKHREELEQLVTQRTRELEEREEMFRRFYEVIPDVFMITDMENGNCVSVNDGFCEITGYSREEVVGKSTLDLNLWKDDNDRTKLVEGISKNGFIANLDAEFRKKNGSYWPGIMSACSADLKGRKVVLSSTKNIAEIRSAQDEAVRASQAKSEFLSSMSHELRTPLNAVLGFAQMLQFSRKEPLTDKQKNSVGMIVSSGDHLLELINQVLDLSSIESGNLEVSAETLNPLEIIRDCIAISEAMGESRSITVERLAASESLPAIYADPLRFKQVLLNLLSNAIKYNREGGGVAVDARRINQDFLRISVSDQGPGISVDDQASVFEPFKRFGDRVGKVQGAGIGLTISKQLVELMGGDIGFESSVGAGSTFWIEMPLSDDVTSVGDSAEVVGMINSNEKQPESESLVLCIEDNPINVEVIEIIFEEMDNTRLLIAESGEEGIELAQIHTPDLILMDIGLPGIDGVEATRLLKQSEKTQHIPVIALSAAAMEDDIDRAQDVGFYAYVTKPLKVTPFLELIVQVLSSDKK